MINRCDNCKIILKGDTILFLCPYDENLIGLDVNQQCRLKLLSMKQKLPKNFKQIIFSNTKIKKTFYYFTIKKFLKAYDFLQKPFIRFKLKYILKLKQEDIINLLINPLNFLNLNDKNKLSLINILYKDGYFNEIIDYIHMEYDKNLIFKRLFENDIDIDERWLNNYELLLNIRPATSYTIKIFKTGRKNLYFVKLEKDKICEKGSIFEILENMEEGSNALKRLIAAIQDPEVQEIYLDKENSWVYLDHALYGRCDTNIFLNSTEVEKFKTFISMVTGEEISIGQPSVKISLKEEDVKLRISIDTYPIVEDTSIDIRKFRKKLLSLKELVEKGSLSLRAAAFLVLCLRNRFSIVICGEPNSGKTTLAHALARFLPSAYRKIYLEDVDEVYSSVEDLPHSVFIKTSSIDVSEKYSKKSIEIIKLLHRSPDWIFLGELQTKEHSKAFFHALLAGLRGMVTCHANSAYELIKRWVTQHDIPIENISIIDLIIEMRKEIEDGNIRRYVNKIFEINTNGGFPELIEIYNHLSNKFFDIEESKKILEKFSSQYSKINLTEIIKKIESEIMNEGE